MAQKRGEEISVRIPEKIYLSILERPQSNLEFRTRPPLQSRAFQKAVGEIPPSNDTHEYSEIIASSVYVTESLSTLKLPLRLMQVDIFIRGGRGQWVGESL